MSKQKYTCEHFEAAIPNSGGIISTIAKRVGCTWPAARDFIKRHPTLQALYDAELETNLDYAESLIITNIKIAHQKQMASIKAEMPELVSSEDAKWFVSKRGKGRGYSDKIEQQNFNYDMSQLTTEQLQRIANGEDYVAVIAGAGNS